MLIKLGLESSKDLAWIAQLVTTLPPRFPLPLSIPENQRSTTKGIIHAFIRLQKRRSTVENVNLQELADKESTPLYVYSKQTI